MLKVGQTVYFKSNTYYGNEQLAVIVKKITRTNEGVPVYSCVDKQGIPCWFTEKAIGKTVTLTAHCEI